VESETKIYDSDVEIVTSFGTLHTLQDNRLVKRIVLLMVDKYFYWYGSGVYSYFNRNEDQ
jgi:hypothetical protein